MDATALGWGFVGTGQISHFMAADLAEASGAHRRAVTSRSAQRARDFAAAEGFAVGYDRLDDMLGDDAVDVVYIATPPATHTDIAVAALGAGKHVLVEKPLAVDAAAGRTIAAAARCARRFAMEAMWMRFNPAYIGLLADVHRGDIGTPTAVRATFGMPFGPPDSDRWSAAKGSGTLLDQAIYGATLARDVLGEPVDIIGTAEVRDDGVDLTAQMTMHFTAGRFAQLAASMTTYLEPSAAVSGTAGWLAMPAPFWAAAGYRRHLGDPGTALLAPQDVTFPTVGYGYLPMLQAVHDAIARGWTEHPQHPLADSLAVLAILDRARESLVPRTVTRAPRPITPPPFEPSPRSNS
jgi:predicted dehydrogenase